MHYVIREEEEGEDGLRWGRDAEIKEDMTERAELLAYLRPSIHLFIHLSVHPPVSSDAPMDDWSSWMIHPAAPAMFGSAIGPDRCPSPSVDRKPTRASTEYASYIQTRLATEVADGHCYCTCLHSNDGEVTPHSKTRQHTKIIHSHLLVYFCAPMSTHTYS